MSNHYSIYESKFEFECERRARLRTEQLAKQCAKLQAENERLKQQRDAMQRRAKAAETDWQLSEAENERLRQALEKIRDAETTCCPRCEGNGRLWTDGKAHYPFDNSSTVPCGNCGGSGRLQPENAQDIAAEALAEQDGDGKEEQ